MRRSIVQEEWWPVYELQAPNQYDPVVEVSDELVERYEKAAAHFADVQTILREMHRQGGQS